MLCFKNLCKYLSRDICKREAIVEKELVSSSRLEDVKYEETIPFVPTLHRGKVVKVYDGDTFTIASKLYIDAIESDTYYRFSVRIKGIDTPELKTKNETEKILAIAARNALSSRIENRIVELKHVELEKYGRILADVYIDGIDIAKWMIQEKHAVPYDGKTKNIPKEWTAENN